MSAPHCFHGCHQTTAQIQFWAKMTSCGRRFAQELCNWGFMLSSCCMRWWAHCMICSKVTFWLCCSDLNDCCGLLAHRSTIFLCHQDLWNIDDRHKYPINNNKDNLFEQLTTGPSVSWNEWKSEEKIVCCGWIVAGGEGAPWF